MSTTPPNLGGIAPPIPSRLPEPASTSRRLARPLRWIAAAYAVLTAGNVAVVVGQLAYLGHAHDAVSGGWIALGEALAPVGASMVAAAAYAVAHVLEEVR